MDIWKSDLFQDAPIIPYKLAKLVAKEVTAKLQIEKIDCTAPRGMDV